MWYLAVSYLGYCLGHARSRRKLSLGSSRGLGFKGYARGIRICQGKKPMCRTQHAVCAFRCAMPLLYNLRTGLYINFWHTKKS